MPKFKQKIKDNNYLYCVLYDSHCVRSEVIPFTFLWIKEIQAENCISCAVSDIIPGDALVLVANENSWTTVGVAVVQTFLGLA